MTRANPLRSARKGLDALVSAYGLISRSLATPLPSASHAERLASLPKSGLPIAATVTIHWNDHLVPFITAESDDDLAFAIGYVQAHLRLGHIEVTRRIATGRLAESFGPIAAELDAGLRLLNFGEATPATEAALPPTTHRWVQRYCDGLNHYQATANPLPHDVRVLDLGREPFTVADVLTIGRLVGNDINWLGWARVVGFRHRPDWPAIWADAVRYGGSDHASFSEPEASAQNTLDAILEGVGRSGSNCIAIAGSRTRNGSGLLAGDPHVGIFLPSLFTVLGISSPSYRAVGLMIPGVPVLLTGRNAEIAWGATNMRAASSDLVKVDECGPNAIEERTEQVKVRWGRPRTVSVRKSPYGPVVSDAPIFPKNTGDTVALRWMGHRVTDEITAMLKVTAARDFKTYRAALGTFGVSGQNFLYADRHGHIGQVMAVHLPSRHPDPPDDPVLSPAACIGWDKPVNAEQLPFAYDPPDGYLVSANNQPAKADVLIGYFFSANDRISRLKQLIGGSTDWTMEALAATQLDVVRPSAVRLRDALLAHRSAAADAEGARLLDRLVGWDGAYSADRFQPAALEFMALELADALAAELGPLRDSEAILDVLADRLLSAPPEKARTLVARAAAGAARRARRVRSWGQLHRLKLFHILANVPGVSRRYPRAAPPVSGSTTTMMKTAHDLVRGRHGVRFGANARHVFDMADPDANWFVVLGGQDGHVGSPHMLDQLPLWLEGRYMRVPLRPETVAAEFKHVTRLQPAA